MPMCCVHRCSNYRGFVFPRDPELKEKWLHAIKREKTFAPKAKTIVCEAHFTKEDFATEGEITGLPITKRRRLKRGVIPSVFIWKKENVQKIQSVAQQEQQAFSMKTNHNLGDTDKMSTHCANNVAKIQSNSCEQTKFGGKSTAIDCEDTKANITDIVIKSEDTTVGIDNNAEGSITETIIGCEETKSDYTATEISCVETKINIKDIKLEVQNAASQVDWNNAGSDDHNLKSPNVNVKIKCEPQLNYVFVDVGNIKQEYEDSDTTLVSTFTDNGEASHRGDDFSLPIKEEQFLLRKNVASKSFQCDVCNKSFRRLHDLKRHKYIHTGEKRYQCDVCNKSFPQSGALTIHRRLHTGEKPYQCDICNKFFNQSPHLIRHKRTHTGDKPYQCDICNKCFTQSNNLNEHRLTHTGKKPYQCDVCNKCYTHSSNLIRHKYTHSGETSFQCDQGQINH